MQHKEKKLVERGKYLKRSKYRIDNFLFSTLFLICYNILVGNKSWVKEHTNGY